MTTEAPEYCPGAGDPRCKGMCTKDFLTQRIYDPDCFRTHEIERANDD